MNRVVMFDRQGGAGREDGGGERPRLGEILVHRRALEPTRLSEALARQPDSGRRLGDVLVARGWASGGAVAGALAEQWGVEFVDLEAQPADGALVDPARAGLYLAHRILPWQRVGGVTVHVTDRPEDAGAALAALEVDRAAVAVAPARQLDAALGRLLGAPLADRAAARTGAGESVRSLGRARAGAVLALGAVGWLMLEGGTAGLLAALGILLLLNAATTVLRLMALVAGSCRSAAQGPAPGTVDLAARRPLPVVTLMVPLYREARMVGEIVPALEALDYPRELLDVKLLLEAGDAETRAAVEALHAAGELPGWITPVTVPEGAPRTKPRAMNFALDFAEGEVVGILDAEDRPDVEQLRRVAEALAAAPPEVACVQCQLGYYNARENWLTRCFQIEYAIWFEVLLRGFQRLGLPVPLGGTSVYFRGIR